MNPSGPNGPRTESEARLKPYVEAATAAMKSFDFAGAERQYRAAIDAAERFSPPDPLALAQVLEGLAALGALGQRIGNMTGAKGATESAIRPAETEALRERARRIVAETVGEDSPAMAEHLTAEATTLLISGRSEEAEAKLREALALAEREPENGRRLMAVLTQLGLVQMQAGRMSEAEAAITRAVQIGRTASPLPGDSIAPGPLSPTGPVALAGALNLLAMLHNQEGRFREAEAMARESVSLLDPLEKPPSQLVAAYNTLAMALRHQWRLKEAWKYYRRYLASEWTRWPDFGWGTRLTMAFANLLMFVLAFRIKAREFPRN